MTHDPFGPFGFDLEAMCAFIPKLRPLIHNEIKRACGEHLAMRDELSAERARANENFASYERVKAKYSILAKAARRMLDTPDPPAARDIEAYLALRKALADNV